MLGLEGGGDFALREGRDRCQTSEGDILNNE